MLGNRWFAVLDGIHQEIRALRKDRATVPDVAARLAELETLQLKWISFKDEMNRLVNRLEKVEQRAARRKAMEEEEAAPPESNGDEISERVMRRRASRYGIRRASDAG